MKPSIEVRRASHVNSGTAISRDDLPWPEVAGRVTRLPRTHVEVDERSEVTPYGGLAIATAFLRRFKVAECIDRNVQVFLLHLPYHESDHVLAQALNLYTGGTCIEDIANLQHSEAVRRLLGAPRIPDPTTAGDFLRRFHEKEHQLPGLRRAVDEVQVAVWRRSRRGRDKRGEAWSIVDVDGHVKPLYGVQKEGADFYKKAIVYLDQKTLTSDKMVQVFDTVRKIQGYFDSGRTGRDWNLATALPVATCVLAAGF